jgi:hypothetical protein
MQASGFDLRKTKRDARILVLVALVLLTLPIKAAEDSLAFSVEITLSQKAAAKLAALHEGIIVSASYSGDPAPGAEKHTDEIGRIDLGRDEIEVPGKAGTVRVPGTKIKRDHFAWVKGPVLLNVNVYSARHTGPDNILACDFFDGNLQDAIRKPMSLHCSLITEGAETKHKE